MTPEVLDMYHLYSNVPGWIRICEKLGCSEETIRELEQYDEWVIQLVRWFREERRIVGKLMDLKSMFPESTITSLRVAFLKTRLDSLNRGEKALQDDYNRSRETNEPFINRAIIADQMNHVANLKRRAEKEMVFRSHGNDGKFQEKLDHAKGRRIDEFIEVKKGKAICPFHADKDPSFKVTGSKGYCFGCGWRGDTIDFVQQKYGYDFKQAIDYLAA